MGPDSTGNITPGSRCIMAESELAPSNFSTSCVTMSCSESGEVLVDGAPCDSGALPYKLSPDFFGLADSAYAQWCLDLSVAVSKLQPLLSRCTKLVRQCSCTVDTCHWLMLHTVLSQCYHTVLMLHTVIRRVHSLCACGQGLERVVPAQIEKFRIFRTIFWVSLREYYEIAGSTRLQEALAGT